MRTLLISQDFHPLKGGIATYLMQIHKNYFSKDTFQALIPENIGKGNKSDRINFEIKKLKFFPFILPSKRKNKNKFFLDHIRKFNPDVILFGYIRSHVEVAEEYKKENPKVKYGIVLHAKEAFLDSAIKSKTNSRGVQKGYSVKEITEYKKILNSADFLICVSNFTKELIRKQEIKNKHVFIILPSLDNIPAIPKLVKKENFTLLSVGRLIKRKGYDLVIKSLKELREIIPEIKYNIVGKGSEEKNLRSLVNKNNLSDIVTFKGEINEGRLAKEYSACDVFVLPTKFIEPNDIEGFGIVFIEASSFGKPVIGGNNGGVIEAIENEKSGFLIDPLSKKEFIDKIVLLYKDRKRLKEIGRYGRKRVIEDFYQKKNIKFFEYLEEIKKNLESNTFYQSQSL